MKAFKIIFVITILIYSAMSFYSYNQIKNLENELTSYQEEITNSENNKNSNKVTLTRKYNQTIIKYEQHKTTLQAFWLEWVFEFKEFKRK